MRNGLWEQINNEKINSVEFHIIKTEEADVLNVALFGITAKKCKR